MLLHHGALFLRGRIVAGGKWVKHRPNRGNTTGKPGNRERRMNNEFRLIHSSLLILRYPVTRFSPRVLTNELNDRR